MAETMFEVYAKLLQIAVMFFILILLFIRQRQFRIRPLWWYISVFALSFLQGVTELLIYYWKTVVTPVQSTPHYQFNEFHSIPYSLAIFAIYLLTEFMTRLRPHFIRLLSVSTLWSAYISMLLYDAFWRVEPGEVGGHTFNTIFNIFQITAMGFVTYIFFQAWKNAKHRENRKWTRLLFISIAIFESVAIYEIFQDNFGFPRIYNAIPYAVTFLIIAYIYLRSPYYIFNVPTEVYRFFLTDSDSGILLYSAEIITPITDVKKFDDDIFAPTITAIRTLMKEGAGSKGTLNTIRFSDRVMMISQVKNIVGYVIANNATWILLSALRQFVMEFSQRFSEVLAVDTLIDVEMLAGTKEIIARCFPFLEAEDVIQSREKSITLKQ